MHLHPKLKLLQIVVFEPCDLLHKRAGKVSIQQANVNGLFELNAGLFCARHSHSRRNCELPLLFSLWFSATMCSAMPWPSVNNTDEPSFGLVFIMFRKTSAGMNSKLHWLSVGISVGRRVRCWSPSRRVRRRGSSVGFYGRAFLGKSNSNDAGLAAKTFAQASTSNLISIRPQVGTLSMYSS